MVIFVYGTLLKGLGLSHVLEESEFISYAIAGGVKLYDLGCYPAIKQGDGTVAGELYSVDSEVLNLLDMVEGFYPNNINESLYLRSEIQIISPSITSRVFAYFYNKKLDESTLVINGDYRTLIQSTEIL